MLHLPQFNSTGGRAHRLSGYFTVLAILLTLMAPSAFAQHVANPYAGATWYLDPYFAQEVAPAAAAESSATVQGQMYTVANQPTALWLTQMSSIPVLQQNVAEAYAQSQTSNQPIVMTIVVYDLPQRDCSALGSNGELSIAANPPAQPLSGIQTYEQDFITPIYSILSRYSTVANLRFVLVIEPDSLPNLVTNVGYNKDGVTLMAPNCVAANGGVIAASPNRVPGPNSVYVEGIQYALNKFHPLPNVYQYLDIGQSAWLGWPGNMAGAVAFYNTVVKGTTAGYNSIDGFISNTANYTPTKEPYLTATEQFNGGAEVEQTTYYSSNPDIDEEDYDYALYGQMVAAGFPSGIGFLIDTSRNGWGGPNRPTAASTTSTNITDFVNASKIDQRPVRGVWCNIANAGIGALPQVSPGGGFNPPFLNLEAYVWIKKPGESDGTYPGSVYDGVTATTGDPNCNPANTNASAGGPTDSLTNPPPAGIFWPSDFEQLVENAYPPLATTAPSLRLNASSSAINIDQGGSASVTITAALSGYTGTVTFDANTTELSGGSITPTFNPYPVTVPGSTTLTLTCSAHVVPGTYVLTVTGFVPGGYSSVNIMLTVRGAYFTLAPAQSALTIPTGSGAIASDAITVTGVGAFDGNVTLTADGLPPCVTASFSPNPTPEVYFISPQVSTLTFTANTTDACSGQYTVMLTGTSGGLTTLNSITLTAAPGHSLPAPSFTLSASPASLLVAQNSSGTETVTATPTNGFSGTISSFSASGFPYGVTISGTSGGGPLGIAYTFTASSAATPGTYLVTITATSGSLIKTTTFQLTVTSFSVSATPSILTVAQGGSGAETVTATPTTGFSGTISSFSVSALPSGVTVSNSSGGPLGITYTFTASSAATAGTYPVTVTATSGSLSKTATFQLTVTAAASAFGCHVVYTNSWQGGGGFGAAISIQNTGSAAINSWTLKWAFPSGQTITSMWDQGTYTQSGANVTVTNASYDGTIAAGATFTGLGFNGTLNPTTNANAAPTSFAVNGTACK